MAIFLPTLKQHEGLSLKAYQDVARVWTICYGHAYVDPKLTMTQKQCDKLAESDGLKFMLPVLAAIKVPVSPTTLAAHTHFAVNIGIAGYRRSTALKLTNQKDYFGGCNAFMNWDGLTLKGKKYDCGDPQPKWVMDGGCRGLLARRVDEVAQCLSGI